jgi:hypothetical protein
MIERQQKNLEQNLFRQLNLYESIAKDYFNVQPGLKPNYSQPNMGLINNKHYCLRSDNYFYSHPEQLLKHKNFITDYNQDGLARQLVMKSIG